MKKSNDTRKRISAEGLIIALEHLVTETMAAEERKAGNKPGVTIEHGSLSIADREFRVKNLPALIFSLTHPWVELHTNDGLCDNTKEAHEKEYEEMLDMSQAILKNRSNVVEDMEKE